MSKPLDPTSPVASLLSLAGLTQSELAKRLGIVQGGVGNAIARRGGIAIDWLVRAARAAGYEIQIRAVKRRGRPACGRGDKIEKAPPAGSGQRGMERLGGR